MHKNKILEELVKKKVKSKIISIEKFTEACLYGKFGYYNNSNIIGKKGDFITSPEISQLYGDIIGLFILYHWKINLKKNFNFYELGPGKGTLLIDLLNITKKFNEFQKSMNIYLIEKNIKLIEEQKSNILSLNYKSKKISWLKNFSKQVGFSDHSLVSRDSIFPSLAAIAFGAELIERHFTVLDANETKDGPVSINGNQLNETQ